MSLAGDRSNRETTFGQPTVNASMGKRSMG